MTSTSRRSLETRKGAYVDSVTLMQVSKRVAGLPGVRSALVAMATDLNLEVIGGMGFELPGDLGTNDLLIAIRAADDDGVAAGRAALEAAFAALRGGGRGAARDGGELPARTLGRAVLRVRYPFLLRLVACKAARISRRPWP